MTRRTSMLTGAAVLVGALTCTTPAWAETTPVGKAAAQAAAIAITAPRPPAPKPPNATTVVFSGRGYGHGRGMSQWGAHGAATKAGLNWQQILDFYYPTTVRHTQADLDLRVQIRADSDGDTQVPPQAGLYANRADNTAVPLPTGVEYTAWRLARANASLQLQFRNAAGGWAPYASTNVSGVTGFGTTNGTVAITLPSRATLTIRGKALAVLDATGKHHTLAYTTMETYLRGVIGSEMPASWHPQALAAQTVAARTYATAYRQNQRKKNAVWDICDTTTCQVYRGVSMRTSTGTVDPTEDPRTDGAIQATNGTVLRVNSTSTSALAYTEFSASNGGTTVSGGTSYLVAQNDPYDGAIPNTANSWSVTTTTAEVAGRWGLATVTGIGVTQRDGLGPLGGHATEVTIRGTDSKGVLKVVKTTGNAVRSAYGMKSTWFSATIR